MKKLFSLSLLFAAVLAASSCGTVRHSCPSSQLDSTRVEVRTETVTKTDTVTVELPVVVEKVATLDTLSLLENVYARSEASVENGILHHSLETKPARLPVAVEHQIVYRDSVVYRDRTVTRTVEVPRPLTRWQKFRQTLGGITLASLAIALVFLFLYFTNLFNLKRL